MRAALAIALFVAVTGGVAAVTGARLNVPGDPHGPRKGLQDFRDAIYYPVVALLDGENPYDAGTFVRAYPVSIAFPLYPPAALVVHLPLGFLSLRAAEWTYFACTAAVMPVLAWLVLRLCAVGPSTASVFGLATVLVVSRPGYWNLFLGQYAATMALGVYAALYFARRRPALAAAGVGLALLKPTYGGPLAVLMLARREVRPVVAGLVLTGLVSLVALPYLIGHAGGAHLFLASLGSSQKAFEADPEVNPATSIYRIDAAAFVSHVFDRPVGAAGELGLLAGILGLGALGVRRLARQNEPCAEGLGGGLASVAMLAATYHQTYDLLLLALPIVAVATVRAPAMRGGRALRGLLLAAMLVPAFNHLMSAGVLAHLSDERGLRTAVVSLNSGALLLAAALYAVLALRWRP